MQPKDGDPDCLWNIKTCGRLVPSAVIGKTPSCLYLAVWGNVILESSFNLLIARDVLPAMIFQMPVW